VTGPFGVADAGGRDDLAERRPLVAPEDTTACTTRPSTSVQLPTGSVCSRRHSSATGDSAIRGGATSFDGSRVTPVASISLSWGGKSVAVALIASSSGSGVRHTVNSPVATALRSESFSPTDVNCTTGGSVLATVKNECGARLSTPSAERVTTHAIARGTITEVRNL
jgi:hypothetical protein